MGNTIAFNAGDGVQDAPGPMGNTILGNSIFSNGQLGILDNGRAYPPALTSATSSGGTTTVAGTWGGPDPARIEFFWSSTCDASGFGEGELVMGGTEVAGGENFSIALPAISGGVITATATSTEGTSGFSACLVPDLASVAADLRAIVQAESAYQSSAAGLYGTLACLATPSDCIDGYPVSGPVFLSTDLASLATRAGYVRGFSAGPGELRSGLLVPGLLSWAYTAVPESGFGPGYCLSTTGAFVRYDGIATAANGQCTSGGTPLP
jgi:hypothetical protein